MNNHEFSMIIVGVGGQGVLLAAKIISEAAVASGYDCLQSEIHGMAQRGGVVSSSIKIGHNIGSPLIPRGRCNLLLGFEPIETYRAIENIGKKSIVVSNVEPIYPFTVTLGMQTYPPLNDALEKIKCACNVLYTIEATKLAKISGNKITANIVMLGAATATGIMPITKDTILESVKNNVPPRAVDINIRAFELGYNAIEGQK